MNRLQDKFVDTEGLAVIIDRKPRCLQAFLWPFRRHLSKPQFAHLWTLLLAWVANVHRSTVLHLAARLPDGVHRTSRGRFLTHAKWDGPALLDQAVTRALRHMRPRSGEALYLIIDDHRIAKRGRKMHGVSKIWDHKQQRFVHGHIV